MKSAIKPKRRLRLRDRRGVTLVETVVSLLLTALIVTMTAVALTGAIKMYHRLRIQQRALEVAGFLCDDIKAELSLCYGYKPAPTEEELAAVTDAEEKLRAENYYLRVYSYDAEGDALPSYIPVSVSGDEKIDTILFQENSGNNAYMAVTDGRLVIYYPNNTDPNTAVPSWGHGASSYYGLRITEMTFDRVSPSRGEHLTLKLTLTLSDGEGWSYTTTRFIECKNIIPGPTGANGFYSGSYRE